MTSATRAALLAAGHNPVRPKPVDTPRGGRGRRRAVVQNPEVAMAWTRAVVMDPEPGARLLVRRRPPSSSGSSEEFLSVSYSGLSGDFLDDESIVFDAGRWAFSDPPWALTPELLVRFCSGELPLHSPASNGPFIEVLKALPPVLPRTEASTTDVAGASRHDADYALG